MTSIHGTLFMLMLIFYLLSQSVGPSGWGCFSLAEGLDWFSPCIESLWFKDTIYSFWIDSLFVLSPYGSRTQFILSSFLLYVLFWDFIIRDVTLLILDCIIWLMETMFGLLFSFYERLRHWNFFLFHINLLIFFYYDKGLYETSLGSSMSCQI